MSGTSTISPDAVNVTHQIIKQRRINESDPQRYAIFSTGVDRWIKWDLSADQVIAYYTQRAAEKAERDTRETLANLDIDPKEEYADFALTYEEANADSVEAGGQDLIHCGREIRHAPVMETSLGSVTQVVRCTQFRGHGPEIPHSGSAYSPERTRGTE